MGLLKEELLHKLQKHYEIVHAYDDPRIIAMYDRNGIPNYQVPGWPMQAGAPILPATEEPDDGASMGLVSA